MAVKMQSLYKLVTFDATNTILKFRIPPVKQYLKAGNLYGISVDERQLKDSFKRQWKELSKQHPHFGSSTGLTSIQWWTIFVKETFVGAGCNADDTQLSAIASYLIKLFGSRSCWEAAPFSPELLQTLKQNHLKLGVISNFDERLDGILHQICIRHWFDFVICSYTASCSKPDAKIFELALSQVNGITSKEAIHIGDNIDLDFRGAQNAGWNAILLQKEETQLEADIDKKFVVHDLKDILNIILPTQSS